MRACAAALLVGLILAPSAIAAPFTATLSAPTHTPKTTAKWNYTIRVTSGGQQVRASLTAQIIDPFGGAHPATYANTNKPLVNWPFTGVFHDYLQFPPESKGFKVTLRFTLRAKGARKVLTYWIRPT